MSATFDASAWLLRLGMAAASATIIGGGSMALSLQRNDAVQDVRIEKVEQTVQKIDQLDTKLEVTLREVAVLNDRLKNRPKE